MTLQDELSALEDQRLREAHEAEARLKNFEAERERIAAEQQALVDRLADIDRQIDQLLESRQAEDRARPDREFSIVQAALARSFDGILGARADWKAYAKLVRQVRALTLSDPQLDQAVHDYRAFEQSHPDLEALPPVHRQALIDAQNALRQRVAPYLAAHNAASGLWKHRPLILQVAVARDPDLARIYWMLALPENLASLSGGAGDDLADFMVSVVNGLKDVGSRPGWTFKQVMMRGWAGFAEVMAVDVRFGEGDLAEISRELVQARLTQAPLSLGDAIQAQVAEISRAVWRVGRELPVQAQGGARHPAQPAHADSWYTDEDIRNWNRPFTTTLNLLWNAQARRLRTLLMRMIDRGIVGDNAVPLDPLWKSLPTPDDREMLAGIGSLIAKGLLLERAGASDGDRYVSIHPDMLTEAHNLINRNVTDFWVEVLGAQAQNS